jgi:hypothetical protein
MSTDEKKQVTQWLISLGVFGSLLLLGYYFAKPYIEQRRSTQTHLIARDIISEQIHSAATILSVVEMTSRYQPVEKINEPLTACLLADDPQGECTVTSPAQQQQFVFKDSIYENSKVLAGTVDNPGIYKLLGKIGCDQTEPGQCPGWIAHIWFWAECADKAPRCDKAEKIWIRHQVVPGNANNSLPPHPPSQEFNDDPTSFAESIRLTTP